MLQTSSVSSSSNNTTSRADPRKLRAVAPPVPISPNNMPFQQLPPLPTELANRMPLPFFNSPPPQIPSHSFFSHTPQVQSRPNFRSNFQNGGSDRRRSSPGDFPRNSWRSKKFRNDGSNQRYFLRLIAFIKYEA